MEGARAVSSILDDPTHVIADSCDSPEVTEAKDCLGVNVSIVRVSLGSADKFLHCMESAINFGTLEDLSYL